MGLVTVRLYEREAVVEAIRRLLDAASAGRGGTVFVVATAGLGKTSVLQAAVAQAQGQFDIRMGGGDAVEAALPYGLIAQALGQEDALAVPGTWAEDLPAANRFYGTLRWIRQAAADRPLLLALDDVHWADPDSLTFLQLLCRRASTLPLAIVATARTWPDPALRAAEQLAAYGLADIQRLAPLTDQASLGVLRDHFGDIGGDAADRAVAQCDGNPLLLQLALPDPHATGPRPAEEPKAGSTRRLLLARFAAADPIAQRYVRAASVLGTRFRLPVAATMTDLPAEQVPQTVEALFRADLLRGDDAGWARFRHGLIRQAVYDDLTPPIRIYLHERALRALLASGVPASEAAEHAIAASLIGDAQAIETLTAAGRAALHEGAVQAARRYLEAAARLAGDSVPVALQVDLVNALLGGGAAQTAATLADRILARPGLSALTRLSVQLLLGRAAFQTGAVHRAGGLFDAVATEAGRGHPEVALRALLDHTLQSWARLGPQAALPVAVRARRAAAGANLYQQACAEGAWALCAWLSGDPAGLSAAERAASSPVATWPLADAAHWGLDMAAVPSDILVWAERFPLAERLLTEALRIADERAEPFLLFHAAVSRSDLFRRLGRLGEAVDEAERACDVGELVPVGLPLARAAKGLALLEVGRLTDAAACLDPAVGQQWYLAVGYQLRLRATLAYRQGQIGAACSTFAELERRMSEWGVADPAHIPYAADAIAAYLAAGRRGDAARMVDWLARCPLPSRWPAATAAAGRAALAVHDGDLETADAALAACLDLTHDLPTLMARCRTLTAYGAVLTRRGQRDHARQVLSDALAQAQGCGAGWYAQQALIELRRAGGRIWRVPPGELSPQEKAVARLARAGRTNRQISSELYLSVNTVETHLASAYRKLGIRGRSELAGHDLD